MISYSEYISNPVCKDQLLFSREEISDGQINMKHPCGIPAMIQINRKAVNGPKQQKHAKNIMVPEHSTRNPAESASSLVFSSGSALHCGSLLEVHDYQRDTRAKRSSSFLITKKMRNKYHDDESSKERISRDTKLEEVRSRKTADPSSRLKRAYMDEKFSFLDFWFGWQMEEEEEEKEEVEEEDEWVFESRDVRSGYSEQMLRGELREPVPSTFLARSISRKTTEDVLYAM
jgi:hypothetical protein